MSQFLDPLGGVIVSVLALSTVDHCSIPGQVKPREKKEFAATLLVTQHKGLWTKTI